MANVAAMIIVGVQSIYDVKYLRVPKRMICLGIILSLLYLGYGVYQVSVTWENVLLSWLPSIFFLMLAFITRNQMGYADGIALWMIGNFIGGTRTWKCLILALVFGGLYSICGILRGKIQWNSRYPFLPFLSMAVGVEFFISKMEEIYGAVV